MIGDVVIHIRSAIIEQVFCKIVPEHSLKIGGVAAKAVARFGEDHHIKFLAFLNECIGHSVGMGRVNVVIHFAMNKKQAPLKVACEFLVGRNL